MKKIVTLIVIMFYCVFINAQNLIAVQHAGTAKFYTTVDSALTAALKGDTINLPGGSFTISGPIAKSVHIIGTGYNGDSSKATGITLISGYLTFIAGADYGSIEGIAFNGYLNFDASASTKPITNFIISYCNLPYGINIVASSTQVACQSFIIKNNYLGRYGSNSALQSALISSSVNNNIINSSVNIGANNLFANNIFFFVFDAAASSSCIYQDNIFATGAGSNCLNSTFNNNINGFPDIGHSNIGSESMAETFDKTFTKPGVGPTYSYDVHNNYHLKATSLGHNKGTDGTDVGIYGGAFPWKDGSMPSNPHIVTKVISATTDTNGNLNVNIKVNAQKN